MECSDIQQRLSAYIEGNVSAEEEGLIEEHLKACQQCNESLADLKKTLEYVQNLEEIEPPPWLKQKVMARVRSEAEAKRGIFQRIFYPLHIKLPIEALAVIVIAVTTIYVFKTMQPELELIKAPSEEVSPRVILAEKEKHPALDEGKPLPARPAEKFMIAEEQEIAVGDYAEPKAPPRVVKREEGLPPAGTVEKDELKRKALSSELRFAMVERKGEGIRFTLTVLEIETASKEIEEALLQLNGKIVKREHVENRDFLTAELDSQKLKELYEKLQLIGEVEEKEVDFEAWEGDREITIEILKKP